MPQLTLVPGRTGISIAPAPQRIAGATLIARPNTGTIPAPIQSAPIQFAPNMSVPAAPSVVPNPDVAVVSPIESVAAASSTAESAKSFLDTYKWPLIAAALIAAILIGYFVFRKK